MFELFINSDCISINLNSTPNIYSFLCVSCSTTLNYRWVNWYLSIFIPTIAKNSKLWWDVNNIFDGNVFDGDEVLIWQISLSELKNNNFLQHRDLYACVGAHERARVCVSPYMWIEKLILLRFPCLAFITVNNKKLLINVYLAVHLLVDFYNFHVVQIRVLETENQCCPFSVYTDFKVNDFINSNWGKLLSILRTI